MAYVIKQLLEQGISLTTDPYPSSPKFPSSPGSYPSHSISWVPDNCPTNTVILRSESSKSMVDDSVCLPRLDSLALAQCNVDELKYESARLAQQIQQLCYKLNVPHPHTDMAPELVHTDSNNPCTKPQANISRSEFVPQDLDSSATDKISESITHLYRPKVTDNYGPSPLSPFLALEEETLGDLKELQQTCYALHTELQDTLTYDKGPLSSESVVRYDEVPHHKRKLPSLTYPCLTIPPVSDGEMYTDTGWYMPHQIHDPLSEEPNHPVPSCQASIIVPCDHVVPDVLLRSSPQPRADLNEHRSAPNDYTGQPPPVYGTPPAYHPVPKLIMSIKVGYAHRLILHLYFPHNLVIAQTMGIMFLPKVKMDILVPKPMFRFWL